MLDFSRSERLIRFPLGVVAALVAALCLAVAPFSVHLADVRDWYLLWALATGGVAPWLPYDGNCDYPPVIPYLLTLVEAVRRLMVLDPKGPGMLLLMKLPSLLAHLLGATLLARGLARPFGRRAAHAAALSWLVCPPLLYNLAVWGQWDSLLCLALLAAAVAAIHQRWGWTGAAAGLALAIKLQSLLLIPFLAVFLWRRGGIRSLLSATAAGLAVAGMLVAPMALHRGEKMLHAILEAPSFAPQRSVSAYNGWYLLDGFDVYVRKLPAEVARQDSRRAFGPVTFRQIGYALASVGLLACLLALWRWPHPRTLLWTSAAGAFAVYGLSTQMHGRYSLPGLALLTPLFPLAGTPRKMWLAWCVTATLNEAVSLYRCNRDYVHLASGNWTLAISGTVAVAQCLLVAWALWRLWPIAQALVQAAPATETETSAVPDAVPAAAPNPAL